MSFIHPQQGGTWSPSPVPQVPSGRGPHKPSPRPATSGMMSPGGLGSAFSHVSRSHDDRKDLATAAEKVIATALRRVVIERVKIDFLIGTNLAWYFNPFLLAL